MPVFEWRSPLPVPADDAYAWHARPGAFERLVPPWQRLAVVERSGGIDDGGVLVFEYREGPLRGRWVAIHQKASRPADGSSIARSTVPSATGSTHTRSSLRDPPRASSRTSIDYALPMGGVTDVARRRRLEARAASVCSRSAIGARAPTCCATPPSRARRDCA